MLKRLLLGLVALVVLAAASAGGFVTVQVRRYDESLAKQYELPLAAIELSTAPEVLARGKHLTESLGACTVCHGANFGGGFTEDLGPVGKLVYPNVTGGKGGLLVGYNDAELIRLLRHGVKRDGTTVRMMPVQEMTWWPDADRVAVVSYLRTVPPVDGQPMVMEFSSMAKVLDRFDSIPIDVARRVDHLAATPAAANTPAESVEYGHLLGTACRGCHGDKHLAGGPIPGGPPDLPVPLNLTPHETGLKGWSYDDFLAVIRSGKRKNGEPLKPFMPIGALQGMNETELKALWAYLRSLPPVPFGQR